MTSIGVFGAGWWGGNIIRTLHDFTDVAAVRVYDPDLGAPGRFPHLPKVSFVASVEALLGDPSVTAICVATPPPTHVELTRSALDAGKHVLVEKPPASRPSEVESLGSLAREKNAVYMLDALYLFLEPVVALNDLLSGIARSTIRFVQVHRVGDELRREGAGINRITQTMFQHGTDVVEDLFFHDAALLLHLFGGLRFVSVEKQHLYHPTLCDTARLRLDAEGIPVEATLSWSWTGRRRGVSVYMDDRIIDYDALRTEGQIVIHHLAENRSETRSFAQTPPLTSMLRHFLDAVSGRVRGNIDAAFMKTIVELWEHVRNA